MKKKILILSLVVITGFGLLAPTVEATSVIDDLKSKVQQAIDNPLDSTSVRVNGLKALKALVEDLLDRVEDLLVRVTALEGGGSPPSEVDFTYPNTPAEWATFSVIEPGSMIAGGRVSLKSVEKDFCWQNSCDIKPDAKIIADYSKGTLYFAGETEDGKYYSQVLTEDLYPAAEEIIVGTASFFWFGQEVNDVLFEITMP